MTFPKHVDVPGISGDRFQVTYRLHGDEAASKANVEAIAVENSVEFPVSHLPTGEIADDIMGRVESFQQVDDGLYEAVVSYAVEIVAGNIPQLMNVVIGLSSLLNGVSVAKLDMPQSLLDQLGAPRFGVEGLRDMTGIHDRPLLCTALKPIGLTAQQIADLAYTFTSNGLDMVKDDHALTDLPFCTFEERVPRTAEAVAKANAETGLNCMYMANITGPHDAAYERARLAKEVGVGCLMVSPAITGFDFIRELAQDDSIGLPIMTHPTVIGSLAASGMSSGFSYYVLFGQLKRLCGADISIFTNYGGRFPTTKDDSHSAVAGCRDPFGDLKPIMPMIGGGMQVARIPETRKEYGEDTIFLVGGGLHTMGPDLNENVRAFVGSVQQ